MRNVKREYCINFLALTDELEHLYPLEVAYGTLASLYGNALREHIITKEIYEEAKKHYDKMWLYPTH